MVTALKNVTINSRNMNRYVEKMKKINTLLCILFIVLFSVSMLFPVVASVVNKSGAILAIGYFDVAIAFLCFLVFFLLVLNGRRDDPHITYKARLITEYIVTVPLILIALYFIGIEVNWEILLIGLGWRFWLLIMAVPYLVAPLHKTRKWRREEEIGEQ